MNVPTEQSPLLRGSPGIGWPNEPVRYNGFPYDFKTVAFISLSLVYCYMICGIVTVAIGATLEDLAADVGSVSTDIGSVYVARGVGSILGSFACFYVFEHHNPIKTLIASELITAIVCFLLPFVTVLTTLHVGYFIIGALNSVMQTGAMHVLRNLHGEKAGPWLGGLGACFVSAGVLVPGIQLLTDTLLYQYLVFGGLVLFGVAWFLALPDLYGEMVRIQEESIETATQHLSRDTKQNIPHYWAEVMVALLIFFVIGGGDAVTFYIETYVDDTGIIEPSLKAVILLVFYAMAAVGNVFGIIGQIGISDRMLSLELLVFAAVGGLGMFAVVCFPNSAKILWVGVALYGITTAPTVSYSFNIANRLSVHSAVSSAIVVLGMSLGISLLPYAASAIWQYYDAPLILIVVAACSMTLTIPFILLAPTVSYFKADRSFISF